MTPLPVIGVPVPLAAARRPRLAALDRADARRASRSPRSRSATPERGPARGAHPRRRATTKLRAAMEHYQADLAAAGPRQGRRASANALTTPERCRALLGADRVAGCRASPRGARGPGSPRRRRRCPREHHDDDELHRARRRELREALVVQRPHDRPAEEQRRSTRPSNVPSNAMITDSQRTIDRTCRRLIPTARSSPISRVRS